MEKLTEQERIYQIFGMIFINHNTAIECGSCVEDGEQNTRFAILGIGGIEGRSNQIHTFDTVENEVVHRLAGG